ncbi:cytochrome P450 [Dactylonectria macrodidyma]|uniref:Cytochrome P450 n=1 Tax=Dactylonectria macrodidyma TaxID=307937 RepID=A0A9P9ISR1_9HYPO|nr:cytochrome P450 [Dactylonectria macrodidyma]
MYPALNPVCGVAHLGFVWDAFRGHRTPKIHWMHQQHPIIRIGPDFLSFGDITAVEDIYGHSTTCRKDEMYRVIQGDAPHILDIIEKNEHSERWRLVAFSYASRNVATWEYKVANKVRRLIAQFDDYCYSGEVADFRRRSNLFTVETIADIGSDTTAIQLTNVVYQLLKNPEKLVQPRRELKDVRIVENDVVVAYEDVKSLPYLRACLDEA